MTIATVTVRLAHLVRMRHTATGEVIEPVTARGVMPYGWAMRVRGGEVVVTTRDGASVPPAAPIINVTIGDPRIAALVQTPTVDVTLNAVDITVDINPVPMILKIELSTPTTGAPRSGRTVTALATSGPMPRPAVELPESDPGFYGSGPVVWTAAFRPLDLMVGSSLLRQFALDHTRSSTHVRLVDTT